VSDVFLLGGRVAVVTGGTGAIGGALAAGLAEAGARVVVLARHVDATVPPSAAGDDDRTVGVAADVLDRASLEAARDAVVERFGAVHVLVNCAGGNLPAATLAGDASPFDLPDAAWSDVVDLNLLGTVLPSQVFGAAMPTSAGCSIVNVSSMAASRALTRVGGYGAAKAAVESYTRWLAVELARRGTGIRVNAIAPGFLIGDQNRALLLREDGTLTDRGAAVIERTPLGRFGEPDDLVATVVWLVSDGARFVTGAVIPVDGGFGSYAGV
jgi:NAD(P)-dependent dehydrogenase (short-subunit alcohol dehydrogenase family)